MHTFNELQIDNDNYKLFKFVLTCIDEGLLKIDSQHLEIHQNEDDGAFIVTNYFDRNMVYKFYDNYILALVYINEYISFNVLDYDNIEHLQEEMAENGIQEEEIKLVSYYYDKEKTTKIIKLFKKMMGA